MNFNEVIQSPGRILRKRVYKSAATTEYVDEDNLVSAKTGFNYKIGDGTMCKFLYLETKVDIGLSYYPNFVMFYIRAKTENTNEYSKSFGRFYSASKQPEYDANNKTYLYKLYDSMLLAMKPYQPVNITYPTTCQAYFNALVAALGWTTSITLDITGSRQLEEDIYDGLNLTYRDILDDIFQANGKIGYMSGYTSLAAYDINSLNGTRAVIDDDILKNTNVEFGKTYGPINSLTLSRSNGVDTLTAKDDTSIETYGLTNLTIANNIMLSGEDRGDYNQALFNKYKGVKWDIFDCELTGYGGFSLLQPITITTGEKTYISYVFNNVIDIDTGYSETIYNDVDTTQDVNEYTYTNTDEKADKTAEIIIDKKIGEVDIRGKIIKIKAEETLGIESTNFKVDVDGNMICNSATMNGATINGGELTLHDLGKTNRSSIKIKKDISTYTPVVGNSQYIYSISFETPNNYISSTNVEKTNFIQFNRTVFDDIKGQTTEITTYSFTKTNDGEVIEENIVNSMLDLDITNIIWHCYDESGETIIESKQPHSFGTNRAYLTFTIYNNIDTTSYFKFVNQVESGITEINSTDVIANRYYAYPEELGINGNTYGMLSSSRLNSSTTQSILRLNALDYSGSGSSGLFMMARTRNPSTYPMPLVMEITGNNWTRDILQNQVLWDGGTTGYLMIASQTATLSHKVSEQPHGIVLVWSAYSNSQAQNYNWHCDFVPKEAVALANSLGGNGFCFQMASSMFGNIATKYVYISDGQIKGNDNNSATGTNTGTNIKYANNAYVLRYVIGV